MCHEQRIPTPAYAKPRLALRSIVVEAHVLWIKDAAIYLGAQVWAVRQMIRNREIPHVQIGRTFLIDRVDLDRYIERNKIGIAA